MGLDVDKEQLGTIQSAGGLIALRLFIGILGGSFVPFQV